MSDKIPPKMVEEEPKEAFILIGTRKKPVKITSENNSEITIEELLKS